jgi:PAS domain S-box-containing protein
MQIELRRLIDALPALVWMALPDGRAELLNQRWCDYTGLRLDQAIGFGWQCAIHPQDLPQVLDCCRSSLESGQPGAVEARLRRYDGEYCRFVCSAALLTDESGPVVGWCGINADVEVAGQEALKTNETELQRADAHFTVAQRLSATGSFVSDMVADQHTWSEELYRIFERDPATTPTAHSVRNVVHSEDLDSFDAAVERAIAGHDVNFEFRIMTSRGTVKHLRAAARVSEYIADRPVFMGALQDVTENKVAEQALKASEAELRRAHRYLAEAQRLSRTGNFTADVVVDDHIWSEELYRIFEMDPAIKISVQLIRAVLHPEDLPLFDAGFERSATEGTDFDQVFRIVTPSGNRKHLHAVGHFIEHIEGRPIFIGAIQDVTESKTAEEALSKARAELTHVARVMTLGALTASIAHEVNQPLSGIITNANTCLRMLAADPPNVDGARATAQRTLRDGNRRRR